MYEASTRQSLAREAAHADRTRDRVQCRYCGSEKVYRLFREGFWQERVLPAFGIYPWRCKACCANQLLRKRRIRKGIHHVE